MIHMLPRHLFLIDEATSGVLYPLLHAASQITRRVRQQSGLVHALNHVDHQPRPSSAVASIVCSMSSDVTPSLIGAPSALGATFDPGG